ncbi:MAG TPA: FHA domain-containing protein [Solirubrobacteraceae bacterium]|nr:FHA domain-containing protein [Solirubrobacteraceae bacterium]
MAELTLEIVEGPGAGQQLPLRGPVVIGRAGDADLRLIDGQVSRHHARVSPANDGSAVVEDLGSVNGTFLNHNELQSPARLDPSDELLVGVTVIELRSQAQVAAEPSVLRAVPPALASAPRTPDYVNPAVLEADSRPASDEPTAGQRELNKFLDVRVRRRAQLAPLALVMVIALALAIYFATR